MYLEGFAPETGQPVDAADLNRRECPQESEKGNKRLGNSMRTLSKEFLGCQTVMVNIASLADEDEPLTLDS
jgi:hypothetical protein